MRQKVFFYFWIHTQNRMSEIWLNWPFCYVRETQKCTFSNTVLWVYISCLKAGIKKIRKKVVWSHRITLAKYFHICWLSCHLRGVHVDFPGKENRLDTCVDYYQNESSAPLCTQTVWSFPLYWLSMVCFPKPAVQIRTSRHQVGFWFCHSQELLAMLIKIPGVPQMLGVERQGVTGESLKGF